MIYLNNTNQPIVPPPQLQSDILGMWLLRRLILCILFPDGVLCNVLLVVFRDRVCKCNAYLKKNEKFSSFR